MADVLSRLLLDSPLLASRAVLLVAATSVLAQPGVTLGNFSGDQLPFADADFEIACWPAVDAAPGATQLAELRRILAPDGVLVLAGAVEATVLRAALGKIFPELALAAIHAVTGLALKPMMPGVAPSLLEWRPGASTGLILALASAKPLPSFGTAFGPEAALAARLAEARKREAAIVADLGRRRLAAAKIRPLASPRPKADPDLAARLVLPNAERPDVSVIIPTYGQVGITLRCLAAIAAAPPRASIEVILAEDASGDPAVAMLSTVAGLRLLLQPSNLGFLRNCNAAANVARGRTLLFLNNDTEVMPGAIDALLTTLQDWPGTGLVGARLVFPDGRLQEAGGVVWNDGSAWNWGRGEDPDASDYAYVREVDYCSGAALLVPAPLFAELGGFDEAFAPAYYEDTDLAFRIRAHGLAVRYQPEALVLHHEGVSHGSDDPGSAKSRHMAANRARFLERWGMVLAREHRANGQSLLKAHDHALGRPAILVVDHYVPEPDRDAGSRTMVQFIRSLLEAGWLVKFRPANGATPAPYTRSLQQTGVEVIAGNDRAFEKWLERYGAELDHVLVSRPHVAEALQPLLRRHAGQAAFTYYGHDLHGARLRREATLANSARGHTAARAAEETERRLWRECDAAIYPSAEEVAEARALEPAATLHAITPYRFENFPLPVAPPPGQLVVFVAGFAHPPNVDAAVWLLREIWPLIRSALPGAELALVGSQPSEAVRALAEPGVRVTGWVSEAGLADLYAQARIALVPLRYGAGVKSKVVEALSLGLPLVTTSAGAQGLEGLAEVCTVADDPATLAAAVIQLLQDDAAWQATAMAQHRYASARFTGARMRESLLVVLEAAAARRAARASG